MKREIISVYAWVCICVCMHASIHIYIHIYAMCFCMWRNFSRFFRISDVLLRNFFLRLRFEATSVRHFSISHHLLCWSKSILVLFEGYLKRWCDVCVFLYVCMCVCVCMCVYTLWWLCASRTSLLYHLCSLRNFAYLD